VEAIKIRSLSIGRNDEIAREKRSVTQKLGEEKEILQLRESSSVL
jgi:hypothetical protein